jgi:hypothetical protein
VSFVLTVIIILIRKRSSNRQIDCGFNVPKLIHEKGEKIKAKLLPLEISRKQKKHILFYKIKSNMYMIGFKFKKITENAFKAVQVIVQG